MNKNNYRLENDMAPRSPRSPRKIILGIALGFIVLAVGIVGWIGYRASAALSKISDAPASRQGGVLANLPFLGNKSTTQKLQGEDQNRINILLLGIGGANHPGGLLTDTMLVLSIEPKDNKVALLSVPRDLYVPLPNGGYGKINSAHALGEQKAKGQGPTYAMETVSDVLGIQIDYYVRADFDGFEKIVNALGGIDVNVDKAISDPFFPADDTIHYAPFYITAGEHHMDGVTALKYARSRETTSDFDRSRRQQQILAAVKTKVLSAGTLTNPKKLTDLIDIAGDHVRTNLAVWEMERLASFFTGSSNSSIITKVLDTDTGSPLTSRNDPTAGYIIVPKKGNFSEIQAIARGIFSNGSDTPALMPTVSIQNASGKTDLGGTYALILRGYGYQVDQVTQLSTKQTTSKLIEKSSTNFTDDGSFLSTHFTLKKQVNRTAAGTDDFVIILGSDAIPAQ